MAFNLFPRDFLELQQFQDKSTPVWTFLPQVFRWACWQQVGEFLCLSGANLIRNIHSTWSCFYDINKVGLVIAFVFCNVMRSVKNRDTEDVNNKWLIECGCHTYTVHSHPSFPCPSLSLPNLPPPLYVCLSIHALLSCRVRAERNQDLNSDNALNNKKWWKLCHWERQREGERDEPAFILSVFHTLVSISVSLSAESTSERKTDSELDR